MSIFPLPQFEADLAEADREAYERLKPPTSIVVRYGAMKMVGEFPYSGDAKPGCGSKLVIRTQRGLELGEMLTSTCPNAGCSKSVTRQEMLQYIENSGGRDYPFFTEGQVIRVATIEDMNRQAELEKSRLDLVKVARALVLEHGLDMKVVDAEPILGGEVLTFYFTSEHRVDFRDLVRALARQFHTRIELRQVGARDEARLVADYERCGQHCCCKNFLKVLKPVSMKSAKVQKATLDPLKISGRCGRLMCCLRYEDETYDSLKKNLPRRGSRVGTPEGPGVVLDTQILTQLVLVDLEPPEGLAPGQDYERRQVAVPVEELVPPDQAPRRGGNAVGGDPLRGKRPEQVARRERPERTKEQQQDAYRERSKREQPRGPKGAGAAGGDDLDDIMASLDADGSSPTGGESTATPREGAGSKSRRRGKGRKPQGPGGSGGPGAAPGAGDGGAQGAGGKAGGSSGSSSRNRRGRGRGRGRGGRNGRGGGA